VNETLKNVPTTDLKKELQRRKESAKKMLDEHIELNTKTKVKKLRLQMHIALILFLVSMIAAATPLFVSQFLLFGASAKTIFLTASGLAVFAYAYLSFASSKINKLKKEAEESFRAKEPEYSEAIERN